MRSLAMQALTDDYRRNYPGVVIFGVGDDAHKLRLSDHNEDDTTGSRAAQSDPDTTPEHRAIDVMLGPALNRTQALASIDEILANPRNRLRLRYINFENTQWHVGNDFEPEDNSNDPHPTHVHHSGLASMDDDATPWLGVNRMRTATLYRLNTTGACLLRDGAINYGIPTEAELASIQRLIKAAGGDSALRNVGPEDWAVLLKTGADGFTIEITQEQLNAAVADNVPALAVAIMGHVRFI